MLPTNKILLFVAVLILFALLFGFEFGLILIATAVICFNSYEPFDINDYKESLFGLNEEIEDQDFLTEGWETPSKLGQQGKLGEQKSKMSLWKPRSKTSGSGSTVRVSRGNFSDSIIAGSTTLSSPIVTPRAPIGNTGSPFRKQANKVDSFVRENRENSSLLGNLSSPQRSRPFEKSVQSNTSLSSPLLSSPFLPRVKRAIGSREGSIQQRSNSPLKSTYAASGGRLFSPQPKNLPYPTPSSPGWMPLVRLNRPEKPILNENNSHMVHSPVTVKIAAPSPHRFNNSRFPILEEESLEVTRKAPDKNAVLSALREKSRKRSMVSQEESPTNTTDQQSKRRKQDDSTSSSSSMASEPEFLAELTVNGYSNIPLHMVGMKRPATPTLDMENMSAAERIAKKSKLDGRNNSILSSLSSSKRGMAKEMNEFKRGEKRKPEEESFNKEQETESKQSKLESRNLNTVVSSTPVPSTRPKPQIPNSETPKRVVKETSTQSEVSTATEEVNPPQSLKKKLLLDAEKSGLKMKKGIYASLNSPLPKATMVEITPNPSDYDDDRDVERQRAIDMLRDIQEDENKLQKEKETKQSGIQETDSASTLTTSLLAKTTPQTVSDAGNPSNLTALLQSNTTENKSNPEKPASGFLSALAAAAGSPATSSVASTVSTTTPISITVPSGAVSSSTSATSSAATTNSQPPPQYSFKPVFPTTTQNSSTVAATQVPTIGGFNFTQAKSASPATTTTASAATNIQVTSPGLFSFGNSATPTQTSATFGTGTTTVSSAAPSIFGGPQTSATPSAPSTVLNLSQTAPLSNPVSQTTSSSTAGFSFGATSSQDKPTATAAPFTFAQAPASTSANSSAPTTGIFSVPAASSVGGFSFGGGPKPATTTPAATNPSSMFSFGQSATSAAPTNTTPSTGFAFGTSSSQAKPNAQTQPFSFGQTPAPPAGSASQGLTFGAGTGTTTTTQSGTTGGFSFSSSGSTGQAPFGQTSQSIFGSTQAPTSAGQSSLFASAQSKTAPTQGSIFGSAQTTTTTQSSIFGSQSTVTTTASATPAFGSSTGAFNFSAGTTPAFGQSTGAFGSTNNTTSTTSSPATPFQFGAATQNQSTAFGGGSSTFSFGAKPNTQATGSAFGAKPASTLPVPNFPTTQASTFGQSTGSAFGSFDNKPSGGVFGSSQPQPSATAPAFGQAAPGSFGATNTFSFGQQSSTVPSTPVKGFDFSAAAGAGSPSLQFGAAGFSTPTPTPQTPAMNFGSSTPATPNFGGAGTGFGATPSGGGMFSVGSGATAARPRSRVRRKGAKR